MKALVYLQSSSKLWNAPIDLLKQLACEFPGHELVFPESDEAFEQILPSSHILLCWRVSVDILKRGSSLKWVQLPFVGIPGDMLSWLRKQTKTPFLTTSSGVAAPALAEQVIGYILAFNRRFPDIWNFQSISKWGGKALWKEGEGFYECSQQTALIIGFGTTGREVANRLLSFGTRLIAVKKNMDKPVTGFLNGDIKVYNIADLHDLFPKADWVIITAPLTSETEGMIGEKELASMKKGSGLINVSRGGLIKEKALLESLKSGHPKYVALDVFWEEPLPEDHPLWKFPNVIITPHTGGTSQMYVKRLIDLFKENLNRFCNGDFLRNLVDPVRGY